MSSQECGEIVSDYRVGMIVPSSNLTMETELPRMLRDREQMFPDERFTFHSSRMRMKHVTAEELARMNAQTERASVELADARPDIVASACLVAIMAQGPGYHCHAEAQIAGVLQGEGLDIPVVSSAGALLRALEAMGARRIAMVTPYMKPLTGLVAEYIEDAGVEVCDALSLEVSDNLAVARLDPADLQEHWRRVDVSNADALVLSACVQMPSLAAIQPVEDAAGLPVLSAATATVFTILSELGLEPRVPGAGRLLSGEVRMAPAPRPTPEPTTADAPPAPELPEPYPAAAQ
jgi:maleate isomerase